MRLTDGRWQAYGPLLPPLDDAELHHPIVPGRYDYRVLPAALGVARNDVLILQDQALRIGELCGPQHPAVLSLTRYVTANYDAAWCVEWLAEREVWACLPWTAEAMRAFVARGGAPRPPAEHGTLARCRKHVRDGEEPCQPCADRRAAVNAANYAARRQRRLR